MLKERIIFKKFLIYLFTVIYPNYIIISYSTTGVMNFNLEILRGIRLYQPVINNRGVFNIIIIASVFIIPAFSLYLEKRFLSDKFEYYNGILRKILFGLDNIVETKRKRFLDFINHHITSKTAEEAFLTITQPHQQMVEICNNLKYTVGAVSSHEKIKLSIIACDKTNLINYSFHSDDEPSVEIAELDKNESTAKQALTKKRMVLISDVDRRKKNQWFHGADSSIKSLICFPVMCGAKIPFIVTLSSKEAKTFRESNKELFEFILDTFCSRLLLEHYLSVIKIHHEKQKE